MARLAWRPRGARKGTHGSPRCDAPRNDRHEQLYARRVSCGNTRCRCAHGGNMDTVEAPTISIRKLAEPLGAEITGIDAGEPMPDATFRRIEDAFHEHCVLVFRNQRLTPEGHTRFSRRFGDLLVHVM